MSRKIQGKKYDSKTDTNVVSICVTQDGRWYIKLVTPELCEGIMPLTEQNAQELVHNLGVCGNLGDWFDVDELDLQESEDYSSDDKSIC